MRRGCGGCTAAGVSAVLKYDENKFALYVHWLVMPYQTSRLPYQKSASPRMQTPQKKSACEETKPAGYLALYLAAGRRLIPSKTSAAMQTIAAHFALPKDRKTIELNQRCYRPFCPGYLSHGINAYPCADPIRAWQNVRRRHTKEQAIQAVQTLQEEGFTMHPSI